jgi:MYXO-CTERM domain-containing protein
MNVDNQNICAKPAGKSGGCSMADAPCSNCNGSSRGLILLALLLGGLAFVRRV